nr:LysM domain-containing protein [Enterococcus alcedinis]
MIFLIVAIPIGAGVWVLFEKNKPETAQTIESTIESSQLTSESSTSETESESSSTESSTSVSSEVNESTQSSEQLVAPPVEPETPAVPETPETPTTPENTTGDYIEVLAGEGPNNVAARAGISVDELYRLNGMTADNYFLTPGQQLRIR